MPASPHKYYYQEFAGGSGERYLKKLLRQILPMALYRTWEIFADHQAPDNDCFLGVARLAEIAGRATRTIEKNLAELCAKHLLIERVERKLFREVDGSWKKRAVVIKDFSGLYALAHEYHEWLHSEEYVEADRELLELVAQEPDLIAKLRRFENYRRALYHRSPGPIPRMREEERWFTEYPAGPCVGGEHRQTKAAIDRRRGTTSSKYSTRKMPVRLPEDSIERIRDTSQRNPQKRDSHDSASSSTKKSSLQEGKAGALDARLPDTPNPQGEIPPIERRGGIPSFSPSRTSFPSVEGEFERKRLTVSGQILARTFLSEIAVPFGDRNPRGSVTRVLGIIQETCLEQPVDVLSCLIRAYTVARDTRTIRPEHCCPKTGQANRMPLFCAMFQRLVEMQTQSNGGDYSWQHLEQAIAADEHLTRWWKKQQGLVGEWVRWPTHCEQETSLPVAQVSRQEIAPGTASVQIPRKRRSRLSQTEEEREARAARARRVRARLFKWGIPIQDATVLWEHLACGCPLYHTRQGKEVCALCYPDLTWSEEVRILIRSIVEPGIGESLQKSTDLNELPPEYDRQKENNIVDLAQQGEPDSEVRTL
ncbi:MAG TPA: hypothetical protein VFV38_41030 [Ktedonobacteraceae bacterium]|nr:hypothetical protein [Ktedonobacteraceae bacterium]